MYYFHRKSKLVISDRHNIDPRDMYPREQDDSLEKDYVNFVYVVKLQNGVIKIGQSSRFGSRISALKQQFKDYNIRFVHLFKIITKDPDVSRDRAISLEKHILSLCKNHVYHKANKDFLKTIQSTEVSFEYCFLNILDDILSYIDFICNADLRVTFYPCYKMEYINFHNLFKFSDLDDYLANSIEDAIACGNKRKLLLAA